MASQYDAYQSPLSGRYGGSEMSWLFSVRNRHSTWRKLWLKLAESQKELGIDTITPEALEQMEAHLEVTDEDYEVARVEEKRRNHDVMAHVHAFGAVAPAAAGVIHYGATSCFVTDNTDLILMRDALGMLAKKLAKVISNLSSFALKWKDEPTLGRTHIQPAQLVTVGKRAAHWAQDLMLDLHSIERVRSELKFRGAQGTTGTQASFLEIFQGDSAKCDKLNELLCEKFGFPACYDLSSQTYTRKVDVIIANAVTGIGTSVQKIAGDIRLLAAFEEIEEPFGAFQIGSSAMPFKHNPMRCERICAFAVMLTCMQPCLAITHANQRFERTLDDSAVRRTIIPEMMLFADFICRALDNVTSDLVVYPRLIEAHIEPKLAFMITETMLMKLCAHGVSRQEAHEKVRVLSNEALDVYKNEGKPNDLISRFKGSDFFKPIWDDLDGMLEAGLYIGRCVEHVDAYCGPGGPVEQALAPYKAYIESSSTAELDV
ncbi:hypothetical protein PG984_010667 [Apiospora sp. TS-2023a]